MADHESLFTARPRPAVERCWMCGVQVLVTQMMADGGDACGNVRWYCLDVRGCTERWTTLPTLPGSGRSTEGTSPTRAAAGA